MIDFNPWHEPGWKNIGLLQTLRENHKEDGTVELIYGIRPDGKYKGEGYWRGLWKADRLGPFLRALKVCKELKLPPPTTRDIGPNREYVAIGFKGDSETVKTAIDRVSLCARDCVGDIMNTEYWVSGQHALDETRASVEKHGDPLWDGPA